MRGVCRFCGSDSEGVAFDKWVRVTFTNWDDLLPGNILCADCVFWFEESSAELAQRVGKEKPQRMRNYSHFVVDGEWIPLSKGDKGRMQELLFADSFPELAVIAESGQKHIAYRATRNERGQRAGWVQFEEQSLFLKPGQLRALLDLTEELYAVFSKTEIESGQYRADRIAKFGPTKFLSLEAQLAGKRGSLLFDLAIFLTQPKEKADDGAALEAGGVAAGDMEGDTEGIQESISEKHLAAVRGTDSSRCVHEQPDEVRQQSLFDI